MKKLVLFLLIIFISFSVSATEIEMYHDNFFVSGDGKYNNQVMGQISIRYFLIKGENNSINFGYTNRFWWNLYDNSAPFRELNYQPEIMYSFNSYKTNYIDFLNIGIGHKSNGKSGIDSRSVNSYGFANLQVATQTYINIGINLTARFINETEKKDKNYKYIKEYWGQESGCFIQIDRYEKLSYIYEWGEKHGKHIIKFEGRILPTLTSLKLFAIYEDGYGVNGMIDYDKKDRFVKVGVKF